MIIFFQCANKTYLSYLPPQIFTHNSFWIIIDGTNLPPLSIVVLLNLVVERVTYFLQNMLPSHHTRSSSRKKRRKSSRKPSPKRTKSSNTCICSGCNVSFDHNKKLLEHKKRSDNPDCITDLVKCEFCGALALNQYGIDVHQRSDVDCMNRQIAIDNTNIIVHDVEDGPLSNNQHQLNYSEEPFDDTGLFEIYGNDPDPYTSKKQSSEKPNNSTHDLFVFDQQDSHSKSHRSMSQQRDRHIDPLLFDVTPQKDSTVVDPKKATRRIDEVTHGLSGSLPKTFIAAELFYRECVRNDLTLRINLNEIEAEHHISKLQMAICKVFRLTDFSSPTNGGHIHIMIRQFHDKICDCPDAMNLEVTIKDQHLYAFLQTNGIIVKPNDLVPSQDPFNQNEEEQDDEDERIAADSIDFDLDQSDSDGDAGLHNNGINTIVSSVEHRLLLWQRDIKNFRENVVFDKTDVANIELFQLLRTSGVPKYLFERIQQWSFKHSHAISSINPVKRNTFVKQMRKKVYGNTFSKEIEPKVKEVYLSHGARIPVVYFSFRAAVASLLSNAELMKDDNLLLNPNNPFDSMPDGSTLSDLNSGWWYRETCQMFCLEPRKDILLPIILFIDGSTIDTYGKMSVEPITFTLGIFRRSTRNKPEAWRTIGYIETLKNIVSESIVRKANNAKRKLQDKHTIIKSILKELIEIQGPNAGFEWDLCLGGKVYRVTFKIAVQVIIGDCKGNDELCARYGSHNKRTAGFCRDCKVIYEESDNPYHLCQWITPSDFLHKTEEQMNQFGFHCIENAFSLLDFGAGQRGVYGATPSEPLHSFKLGICKYLFEGFVSDHVPKSTIKKIDKMLSSLGSGRQRQSYQPFPKISVVRNGITSIGSLTADEQFARIFCVYLSLHDPCILKSLSNDKRYIKPVQDGDKDNDVNRAPMAIECMGLDEAKKWFIMFEDTVLYHSWLYAEGHDVNELIPEFDEDSDASNHSDDFHMNWSDKKLDGKDSNALHRIRQYLSLLKNVLNRSQGNQHKLVKLHQQLHNPRQVLKDGSLLNVDGGRCESIAIHSSKNQAAISQKRAVKLNWQIANNLLDDTSIRDASILQSQLKDDCSTGELSTAEGSTADKESCALGSHFSIFIDDPETSTDDNGPVKIKMKWRSAKSKTGINQKISEALIRRLYFNMSVGGCLKHTSQIKGFTEIKLDGHTYRSHPSYWGDKPWYDWAMIQWDHESDPYPAQICMLLDLSEARFMNDAELDVLRNSPLGARLMNDPAYTHLTGGNNYEYLSRTKWMVVRSSLSTEEQGVRVRDEYRLESTICKRYYMEDQYRIIPVDAIEGPAFCLHVNGTIETSNDVSGSNEIILLTQKNEWKSMFLNKGI